MVWQLALFFKLIHQSQFILILGALSVKCHLWSQPMIITSLNKLSVLSGFRSIAPYENINKKVKLLQNVYNLFVYHVSVPSCCRKIVSPGILPWTPHIRYPEFKWTYWKHLLCKQTEYFSVFNGSSTGVTSLYRQSSTEFKGIDYTNVKFCYHLHTLKLLQTV